MSQPLPRYINTTLTDQRAVDRAVGEAEDRTITTVARATLAGDGRRLRGIPICAPGIGGAVHPSDSRTNPFTWVSHRERY